MQPILNRITRVLGEQMGIDPDTINVFAPRFRDELGMDSLDDVEMVMALEEEFEREILDEDAERFMYASVMDIVKYVESEGKVFPDQMHKSQGMTFGELEVSIAESNVGVTIGGFPLPDPEDFVPQVIGVLGDITVVVDKYHAMVKVDGETCLALSRSNGNLEDLCRLLMKSSTK